MVKIKKNLDLYEKVACCLKEYRSSLNDNKIEVYKYGVKVYAGKAEIIYHTTLMAIYEIAKRNDLAIYVSTDTKNRAYVMISK